MAYVMSVNRDLIVSYLSEGGQTQRLQSCLTDREHELSKQLEIAKKKIDKLNIKVHGSKQSEAEA